MVALRGPQQRRLRWPDQRERDLDDAAGEPQRDADPPGHVVDQTSLKPYLAVSVAPGLQSKKCKIPSGEMAAANATEIRLRQRERKWKT